MHERHSFYMRGGSLMGALLVVALLSAAAIGIDSANQSVNRDALLAQGSTAAPTATPVATAKSAEENKTITGKCEIGYDYVVRVNDKGEAKIDIENIANNFKAVDIKKDPKAGNRCPMRPGPASDGSVRSCDQNWYCLLAVCRTLKEGTAEKCWRISKKIPVGGEVDSKKVTEQADAEATQRALDPNLSPDLKANADGYIAAAGGNLSNSDDFLKALNQQNMNTSSGISIQETLTAQAAEKRDSLLREYETQCTNRSGIVVYDVFDCASQETELNAANDKAVAEQRKLEALQRDSERLAGLQKQLVPTTQTPPDKLNDLSLICPPEGCSEGKWNPTTQRLETTFKKDESDTGNKRECTGPFAYLCRNANQPGPSQEDIYLCDRLRDRAACMRVAEAQGGSGGVGASSGYGGAYSSGGQPCSAQQQQQQGGFFGIITTITSLFGNKSSSGNCGSGSGSDAPIPTCRITASPTTIPTGSQPVTLTWQSDKAFSATLSNSGNVSTQGSMTVNPQTTTTYTLSLGGYVDNRTGQQLRGECSTQVTVGTQGGGSGDIAVKAEISCRPQVADIGMSVAVSFACRNANTSVGNGFSTANQMSGSATPVVAQPSIGSDSVTYGLTCSKEGKTDTAQCTVEINKASIVLIANPRDVESGKESNIGWITSGMEACTISSPTLSGFTAENAGSTSVSGVAKSPPLTTDTKFVLSCTTKAGGTKTAETTVKVGS